MAIDSLVIPPAFTTNMVVGRHNAGALRQNDELLRGIAEGWKQYPWGRIQASIDASATPYTTYHRYRSDATILHYRIACTEAAAVAELVVTLTYGGTAVYHHHYANTAGDDSFDTDGTVDLAVTPGGLTDGTVYAVTWDYATADKDHWTNLTIWPVYTTYAGTTGALTYTAIHALADGDTSAAADEYTTWRNNDLYFEDCLPYQFPCYAATYGVPASNGGAKSKDVWWSWYPQRFKAIYYKVRIDSSVNNTTLAIVYDPGGASETTETISTRNADVESHFHVPVDTEGEITQIKVTLTSPAGGYNGTATIYYICNCADGTETLAAPYTVMVEPTPGTDIVKADAGTGRFDYLNTADAYLNSAYAIEGRRDFCIPAANSSNGPSIDNSALCFVRRGDTLYYRATACTMTYGSGTTYDLPDFSGNYSTLDLDDVTGLGVGMSYTITTDGGGSVLDWAIEA